MMAGGRLNLQTPVLFLTNLTVLWRVSRQKHSSCSFKLYLIKYMHHFYFRVRSIRHFTFQIEITIVSLYYLPVYTTPNIIIGPEFNVCENSIVFQIKHTKEEHISVRKQSQRLLIIQTLYPKLQDNEYADTWAETKTSIYQYWFSLAQKTFSSIPIFFQMPGESCYRTRAWCCIPAPNRFGGGGGVVVVKKRTTTN